MCRPVRGETLIFVCSYGCIVGPLKTGLYKLNGGSGRRHAGAHALAGLSTVKTHKNQSFSSHKWKKIKVFRNPRDAI